MLTFLKGDLAISTSYPSRADEVKRQERGAGQKTSSFWSTTLLYPKKLLAFKWSLGLFAAISLVLAAVFTFPSSAEAGILAMLVKFFTSERLEVEEEFPAIIYEGHASSGSSAVAADNRWSAGFSQELEYSPITVVQDNALAAPLNPIGVVAVGGAEAADQIFIYTTRPGDTLSSIAKSFGVSVNTIIWANNISDSRTLKVGTGLLILPVTGVKHEVKAGDTIERIAKKYRASIEDILQFNGLAPDEALAVGTIVIVPDGEIPQASPPSSPKGRSFANLPLYEGFYIRPIIAGRRSRGLHGLNAVDLADSCGLPVLAAADGQVLVSRSSGWNGGYGRYAVLTHANSTQTLYAHLKDVVVDAGAVVRQGQVIGAIGSSGNSTGCHMHFEVRGARNPF